MTNYLDRAGDLYETNKIGCESIFVVFFWRTMNSQCPVFTSLPDELLRSIAGYCDVSSRGLVTSTNSSLRSVFLGRVKLTQEASERFLLEEPFRNRIIQRVSVAR